ncbi:hypothetical protein EFL45_00595 [Weissella confusa]|uniref:hypothetical protein n=1 Tax=Weissella confusa TaxID=1583 RepID=UPI00223B1029|nr:hypothetical protein [Weissella confusa]MCT0947971.1 hypothetical protein [Weissella confusa]
MRINFANETIAFQPHNIDFGVHASFRKDELVKRTAQTNHPNIVVDITDGRRVLSQARLTVEQQRQLSLVDNTQQLLPSRLRYYNKQGRFEDLLDYPVVVTETKDGEPLASVTWQNDEGFYYSQTATTSDLVCTIPKSLGRDIRNNKKWHALWVHAIFCCLIM